ncbi:nucleotidyltransferase family protein [Aeromicrobium alkaliterrae]|uniref:NTP transferase domain-containing protein n=1 Tax=Aeromicrobium alkaliterrae TaxID=302168 RepID=A0ABP4VYR3_9ACTN
MPDGVAGLVLAAGSGTRFGLPKALARSSDGTAWIALACAALREGGCGPVVVSLGDLAECALHLVPADAEPVVVRDHAVGLSASLRAGLAALEASSAEVAVVTLVDLPEQAPEAVLRVLGPRPGAPTLRRATFDAGPGHPVVIGRDHWGPLVEHLAGDVGARAYLAAHGVTGVDCTDLGGGHDVDLAS